MGREPTPGWQVFSKNCMKMKEIGPRGDARPYLFNSIRLKKIGSLIRSKGDIVLFSSFVDVGSQ